MASEDDDRPTLVQCQACGGDCTHVVEYDDGRYRKFTCEWCTDGAMTVEQLRRWRTRPKPA